MILRTFLLIFLIWLLTIDLVIDGKLKSRKRKKNKPRHSRKKPVFDQLGERSFGAEVMKWMEYQKTFSRQFHSMMEERIRKVVFEKNKLFVENHNRMADEGERSFRVTLNKFADRTTKDLSTLFGNFFNINFDKLFGAKKYNTSITHLPKTAPIVDLRNEGFVTPVQDQTFNCFASWAFATTGALEGQIFRKNKTLIPLSEQYLIDCGVEGEDGCHEGDTAQGFKFAKDFGYQTEKEYPFVGDCSDCPYNLTRIQNSTDSYVSIRKGDEKAMKEVVAKIGPIAVTIRSQVSFILYKSGIYSEPNCEDDQFKHYLLIVGYGQEQNQNYWLAKNSMGTDWGEKGYIRIARNKNMCGIADYPYYPVI